MCLAVCGEIRAIEKAFARVDIRGIETKVNVQLIDNPAEGDCILIHAGFAIEKIDREYFNYLDMVLEKMLEEDEYNENV